jgi:hypothetical protein
MAFFSDYLALTLQELNDNPDQWGLILNDSTLKLMEEAFVTGAVVLTGTTYTLGDGQGTSEDDHYRFGILNITGNPGGAANVNLPVDIKNGVFVKKYWLVVDNTTGGHQITFKTSTGTGVNLTAGRATFCYCDGTNIKETSVNNAVSADSATTATTATNSTQLGGVAAANYAQKGLRQTWTAGQVVQRFPLTNPGSGIITPDLSESNSFYCLWGGNWQLAAPTGTPVNGEQFSIVIQQDTGGNHTISYPTTTYIWEGGSPGALSTAFQAVDYLAFEYCSDIAGTGGKWIASILNDLS